MLNQKMFARRLALADLRSLSLHAASAKEIDEAFTTFAQAHPAALLMGSDPYLLSVTQAADRISGASIDFPPCLVGAPQPRTAA